ncbi:hypothetical protein ACEWY4_013665 [Coilia grayii]|uniref:Mitochondrial S-adenosylmethionine carrier protein n=1 Tax=Coilia grayii TaxID=363190 RepID=A0ABD1JX20_9TELE
MWRELAFSPSPCTRPLAPGPVLWLSRCRDIPGSRKRQLHVPSTALPDRPAYLTVRPSSSSFSLSPPGPDEGKANILHHGRCSVLFCAVLCCAVLCCAVLCCGVAAFVTTPLDVAKTRIMLAKAGTSTASGNIPLVLYEVWRSRGVTGLFAGSIPRMTSISLGGFIFLGAYEKVRRTLL